MHQASAPTEGELGTVTKDPFGSKATFKKKVFDITNFAMQVDQLRISGTSNFTDVVKDAEGNTISGNAITLSIIAMM